MNYDIRINNNLEGQGKLELDRLGFLAQIIKKIAQRALLMQLFGYSKVSLPGKYKKYLNIYMSGQYADNQTTGFNLDTDNFGTIPLQLDAFRDKSNLKELTPISLVIASFRAALVEDEDKNQLDEPLINELIRFRNFFGSDKEEVVLSNRGSVPEVAINTKEIERIEYLYKTIPEPQKVIINGVIDELKFSKKQMVLLTKNKERVVITAKDKELIGDISAYFGKEITLTGMAHYKPGGQLSYVGLESFGKPGKGDRYFSKKPDKMSTQQQIALQLRQGKKNNPLDDIIGKWPGDESDEEFEKMLKDLD